MHLYDIDKGFYGGWGIVGGHIAMGPALLSLQSIGTKIASPFAISVMARQTRESFSRP